MRSLFICQTCWACVDWKSVRCWLKNELVTSLEQCNCQQPKGLGWYKIFDQTHIGRATAHFCPLILYTNC